MDLRIDIFTPSRAHQICEQIDHVRPVTMQDRRRVAGNEHWHVRVQHDQTFARFSEGYFCYFGEVLSDLANTTGGR